jgi:hypothetical protein
MRFCGGYKKRVEKMSFFVTIVFILCFDAIAKLYFDYVKNWDFSQNIAFPNSNPHFFADLNLESD